jgi:hypothetical protein
LDERPLRAADVLWLCEVPPPLAWLVEPVLCRLVLRRVVAVLRGALLRRLAPERLVPDPLVPEARELDRLALARVVPPVCARLLCRAPLL